MCIRDSSSRTPSCRLALSSLEDQFCPRSLAAAQARPLCLSLCLPVLKCCCCCRSCIVFAFARDAAMPPPPVSLFVPGDVDLFLVAPPPNEEQVVLSKIYDIAMGATYARGLLADRTLLLRLSFGCRFGRPRVPAGICAATTRACW